MNERDISSLNRTLKINFPMDELAVYMHGSELDDKAVPILANSLSILGLPLRGGACRPFALFLTRISPPPASRYFPAGARSMFPEWTPRLASTSRCSITAAATRTNTTCTSGCGGRRFRGWSCSSYRNTFRG